MTRGAGDTLPSMSGIVHLVGAGPGDPGLITVKGLALLRRADVVIYDHLASAFLLNEIPPRTERIYVGKKPGEGRTDQATIQALLVDRARAGKRVVRLKGGDPFLFGRGGEEAEALAAAGIPFEIVPGITSALAVPAYAGIPSTHRGVATSLLVALGRDEAESDDGASGGADDALEASTLPASRASGRETVVLLMGRSNLARNVEALLARGFAADTPAALIRWGTTPEQETLVAPLARIAAEADARGLTAPVVLVVGEVVRLRERLKWWDTRPLFGHRVLVTRARDQAADLVQALEAQGATPVTFPTIEIGPPESFDALDRAIDTIGAYDWAIFTSANAVRCFFERLESRGRDLRDLKGVRIAAIGSSTAQAVRELRIRVDLVPDEYRAEGLLEAFRATNGTVEGLRVVIPRAAIARDLLPRELEKAGAHVTIAEAYRTRRPQVPVESLLADFRAGRIHYLTFTSSSTVRNFVEAMGGGALDLGSARIACIGPVTADTARELGLPVHAVAAESTIAGLVDALVADVGR